MLLFCCCCCSCCRRCCCCCCCCCCFCFSTIRSRNRMKPAVCCCCCCFCCCRRCCCCSCCCCCCCFIPSHTPPALSSHTETSSHRPCLDRRVTAQECGSRGDRPGLPVPNNPYGLCGLKATLKNRVQELCESRGGRPGLPVTNRPYGLCGRKVTLNLNWIVSEVRSCVKFEVDVLGFPSLIIPTASVDVKHATLNTGTAKTAGLTRGVSFYTQSVTSVIIPYYYQGEIYPIDRLI